MKRSTTLRVATLMLALTLITSCFVGGTFAKYISQTKGTDSVTVAEWSFIVEGEDITTDTDSTVTFNIFETINDTGNAADETSVVDGKIAPGTAGSFQFDLENTSEVDAKYTIAFKETNNSNIPLQYTLTPDDEDSWKDTIDELETDVITGVEIAKETGTATHTVYWRWVYGTDSVTVSNDLVVALDTAVDGHVGQTDATDTALGVAAQAEDAADPVVTIEATVVAWQVD
ncbi:MAG: hypothetical protein Q4B31_04360 [Clostridia bacterium]|nr:hypothetical protein [Clostridia bacterium]